MNKKLTRVFLAALLALSVTTAVLLPTITSAYAATDPASPTPPVNPNQPQTPQPPTTEPPKGGADSHSGHH